MALGLTRGEVSLAEHDDGWGAEFTLERRRIGAALGALGCEIEHVGSTAVPGIPAKPILDIAVGCPSQTNPQLVRDALEALGYVYCEDLGESGGHLFARGVARVRTHHLHVVPLRGDQWQSYLSLREFLRADGHARELYAAAKRALAVRFKDDRKSYTEGKASTVQQLLAKAKSS
jgi:GrpB-like predicted nucleotidyltransferase (UPF0157 family)